MTRFGERLRKFRQQCNDIKSPHGKLTQQRLGEVLGEDLGISYSGAAVSDWERGVSRIHAEDRNLLISLIRILNRFGGIMNPEDGNQLLSSGNFWALDSNETQIIFGADISNDPDESMLGGFNGIKSGRPGDIWPLFIESFGEFQTMVEIAMDGPPPAWPRIMVAIFRRIADRLSPLNIFIFFLWIWLWLLEWWLIAPSLQWPFPSQDDAYRALVLYAAGAMIIPALIGLVTNTRENEYWKEKTSVPSVILRLYTHQGAGVGFHLGYFFLFTMYLLLFNLNVKPAFWFELFAMTFPILLGYASARLVPHNLLMTYKRLHLYDGAIFFVFFLLGPIWAYFFYQVHDILLAQTWGVVIFLLAMTLVAGQTVWKVRRKSQGDQRDDSADE